MSTKITLDTVARRVGVSGKTVARVVNGEPHVSAKVRESVLEAIEALNYRPNFAARALASPKSFMIAVLSPPIDNAYFNSVHAMLGVACRERGYHLIIEHVDRRLEDFVGRLGSLFAEINLSGLVLTPGVNNNPAITALLTENGMPWVSLGSKGNTGHGNVCADEVDGEIQLADHLIDLGHQKFLIFRAPEGRRTSRGLAFEDQLLRRGIPPVKISHVDLDLELPGLEAGRRAALAIIDGADLPTAIFCFSDDVAAGAIGVFLTKGVRIPGDISVVGYDDSDIAKAIYPALTTIRQPIRLMAESAIAMLVSGSYAETRDLVCPVELIVRQSTAKAELNPVPVTIDLHRR